MKKVGLGAKAKVTPFNISKLKKGESFTYNKEKFKVIEKIESKDEIVMAFSGKKSGIKTWIEKKK